MPKPSSASPLRASLHWRGLVLAACTLATACATMPTPRNPAGAQYQDTQRLAQAGEFAACKVPAAPAGLEGLKRIPAEAIAATADVIGPGDRLHLQVSGDKDVLTGLYVIAANGRLVIDAGVELPAAGRSRDDLERDLRTRLLAAGLVRDIAGNVRLSQAEAAGVTISVEGAVFEPGLVTAGERAGEARSSTIANPALGDFNNGRTLAIALRAAGGVRPDAALGAVYLIRGDHYAVIDLRSALGGDLGAGGLPIDPQLARGDRIVVPSAGCFQPGLVRPSPVTAPGVRIYMSNLSRPATSNASSAIGKDATSLPYGTRMLQGLISANCVGGSAMNAARSAVLISRNPINGRAAVISRRVEALVRDADRDEVDPYLMPGDAIACYDSGAMTVVDAVGVLGTLLGPAVLLKGLNL